MSKTVTGLVTGSLGGLYQVQTETGPLSLRARGALRQDGGKVLVGDRVECLVSDAPGESCITRMLPRQNSLIRPPLANLTALWAVAAAGQPAPDLPTLDKLFAICEVAGIACGLLVTKADVSPEQAAALESIYTRAGYRVYRVCAPRGEGLEAVRGAVQAALQNGGIGAFAGASGVGKSTLLNALFPDFARQTGTVSTKTGRGRHTTRCVELFPLPKGGYLADTPGFSLLDFARFDFFPLERLAEGFREFAPYLAHCRYADCTHTKEEECGVRAAVKAGKIAASRQESYAALYQILKEKKNTYPR